jgi:hypothetical protein
MKSKFLLASLLLSGLILSSCSKVKVLTAYQQNVTTTNITQWPLLADLEVDLTRKATGSSRMASSEKVVKEAALHEAMKSSGADVIIHPVFDITYGKKIIEVSVSGYPAKFKSIRKASLEDITLMQEMKDALLLNPNLLNYEEERKTTIKIK